MKIKIAKATKEDAEELIETIQKADNRTEKVAREKVSSWIRHKDKFFLVAKDDGKILGYVGLKKYDEDENANKFLDINKYARITWIAILPEYRKYGIGSKLLHECEEYLEELKKEGIFLDCREEIIPFYEKNGYKSVGHYKDENGKIKIVMLRILK